MAAVLFSSTQRLVNPITTSSSWGSSFISRSILVQSVRAVCPVRKSSISFSLSGRSWLKASSNLAVIASFVWCGVPHLQSPLNLLLHARPVLPAIFIRAIPGFRAEVMTTVPTNQPRGEDTFTAATSTQCFLQAISSYTRSKKCRSISSKETVKS